MTFSIVARCARTGELGVAVSTAVPAVGSMCPYVHTAVGAVSTQSWVNPYLATAALQRIAAGRSAREALADVLREDDGRDLRQIGVVDDHGIAAAWTGAQCVDWCGQIVGDGFAIQGNMPVGAATLDAMAGAFLAETERQLAERLLSALEAGQAAGGDKRGRQSAALRVHAAEDYALVDLRVDEHAQPVAELRRVYEIARLQLFPFVLGMPRRGTPAGALPDVVSAMLLRPPPQRPGGGGSGPVD